jgi:GNAT superfamily N-acetyltransferase
MSANIVPALWDEEALEMLRLEFYGRFTKEEFYAFMKRDLAHSGSNLLNSHGGRASDLFLMRDYGQLIGVLFNKYYLWSLIGPQLQFRPHYTEGVISGISLSPLNMIVVNDLNLDRLAIGELAYFLVNPSQRGKGLGTALFDYALTDFRKVLTRANDIVMTLSLGNYAQTDIGRRVKAYLLEREKIVNGIDESSGQIRVKGEILTQNEAIQQFGLKFGDIASSPKSKATEVLAIKKGLKFVGFSSNLSLIYLAEVSSLS